MKKTDEIYKQKLTRLDIDTRKLHEKMNAISASKELEERIAKTKSDEHAASLTNIEKRLTDIEAVLNDFLKGIDGKK